MHRLELVVATKNKKKLEEIREILEDLDVRLTSLAGYENLPRVIENGKTFKENAVKKALKLACFTGKLTMGEDSGLCVEVLEGRPGVYSSRFAGKSKSDNRNNLKVLRLLEGVPEKSRRAYYASAVALADKDGLIGVAEGTCYGRIGFEQRGTFGFGYDPLFVIPRYKKTFAELGPDIKHSMSHRFRALKKARILLQKYIERRAKS
ncbi:MAG: RdgB/HAM1 family non-canonical purine NTP pyrophosphatase [Candidatus Omnitrophica bacterium]|nr:RdgB/HAM1 family non-canonical purine NTP pyrophosphatase [Candidatus Omnitrophota bacterium]